MMKNEMTLAFDSISENEEFARVTVAAFASQLNPTLEEVADIRTAVSEAVTKCNYPWLPRRDTYHCAAGPHGEPAAGSLGD